MSLLILELCLFCTYQKKNLHHQQKNNKCTNKQKIELQYRQEGEKQRIDLARKMKMGINKIKQAYEEQVKVLRSKLLKIKFDNEHHQEKQKRSTQSIILEKDQAIEQLLSQLRDHNDLLQELHQNFQKEQDEKDELQRKVKFLQKQLDHTVETKHPGWV